MFLSAFRLSPIRQKPLRTRRALPLFVEPLEDRSLPSTFSVLNLNNSGPGSLRQAILSANAHVGADVINYSVAGTIRLTTGALPVITDMVDIDGTSAPGFAGTPVVEVNYNGFRGLVFNAGSAGSALRSLGLVNAAPTTTVAAASPGIQINGGGSILVVGNFIGVRLDGVTNAANGGNGVEITNSSGNIIGGATALERNVISGNRGNGVRINTSSNNQVLGNYIGTDGSGTLDRGNVGNGAVVTAGAINNIIDGNVISGNNANGILISALATFTTVSGNFIGTNAAGSASLGNTLDGLKIDNASRNLIGHSNPVIDVTFQNADAVAIQPVDAWQGIRGSDTPGEYYIVGTSGNNGLLFEGTMAGVGASYLVNYPGAESTSVYGPDNLTGDTIRLVGSYKNPDAATAAVKVNGFVFEGTVADLANSANYQTIDYPGAEFNYVHSTMGGLAVGNYDAPFDHGSFSLPLGPGHAYIYDLDQDTFLTDVVFPGSKSNTAYGIWYNGDASYTICGGYSLEAANNFDDQNRPIGQGYLVDYNSVTGVFSNWQSFAYPKGTNYVTHFEGISSVEKGVYTLNADSAQSGTGDPVQGSWVTVRRNTDGTFGTAVWVDLNDPSNPSFIVSSNAVFGNQVVGIEVGGQTSFSFQATVNIGFQLSNVISGNGGNGIGLYAASDNQIAMNFIGTDVTGAVDLGNVGNGILVTNGSARNLIGGEATGGNNPTGGNANNVVFVRPPQGNLISGNNANGVVLSNNATRNQLSGNFIGTTASGNAALGNNLNGVSIVAAPGNSLIGCTFQQDPFVFYNVIAGNGNNGLRVISANDTTIQANFFGIGADNDTPVANALNGVLIGGTSTRTVMGGPIPLGNVVVANGLNGIVVQDQASFFTSYNTFCGLAAFSSNPNLGNVRDGMLITSTGGNILLRTNVIARNGDDGIEISGAARGVRVVGNIIGLNTQGTVAKGNVDNGVEVGGTAHDIIIGGPQPTLNIIPHNAISANGGNGVAILGAAYNVTVSHSYIGTNLLGVQAIGNAKAGIFVGPGTRSTSIGSIDPSLLTVISGNIGNGIEMNGTRANKVVGSLIGTDVGGLIPMGNGGNGIYVNNSFDNVIGRSSEGANGTAGGAANRIAFNGANGVFIASGSRNGIRENSIYGNTLFGIDLGAGANMNQAAPVLSSIQNLPLGTLISGTLTSRPATTFTIEFFATDVNAPSGRFVLGSMKVTTNASGIATFSFFGPFLPNGAGYITATATDLTNNTSEFSAAAPAFID